MRRAAYIKANWKDKWAKVALRKVKELWEVYREQAPTSLASLSPSYSRPSQQSPKELDAFDQIAQNLGKYTRPASQDEYQDYTSGEPYDIGKMPALMWWCQDQQRKRWPRLSYMAMDILSIPAMSDEPERVFSGARRTVSWERAQMEPKTLEMVECLKHWKRSGILRKLLDSGT
jgi:hAT family C-terminal dimerisation region